MKKLSILAVAAIFTLGLTSCKKDYTCKCTYDTLGVTGTYSYTIKETKKKAKDACTAYASTWGGTSSCSID